METRHPATRAVNSGSGNRALLLPDSVCSRNSWWLLTIQILRETLVFTVLNGTKNCKQKCNKIHKNYPQFDDKIG